MLNYYKEIIFTFSLLILIPAFSFADNTNQSPPAAELIMEKHTGPVPLSFVTIRNKTGSNIPADFFGGSRGKLLGGVATVTFSPIWGLEEVAQSAPFYIPDEKIELTSIDEMPLSDIYKQIKDFLVQDYGNAVVYTHGYNIDFEKGCRRAAIFQKALGLHDRLLYFSWPADGNMLKYTWDEADLSWSVPHMTQFFEGLISHAGKGKVDIVAHSLGARGAVQALVRMAYRKDVELIINELVLIAPDIDTDTFLLELPLLNTVVRRITVYVSENDKALKLSHEVHGYRRLGEGGEYLTVVNGIETVDISNISNRRLSGHLYHLFDPEVISDLTDLLHTGKKAAERQNLRKVQSHNGAYYSLIPAQ
ncbi:MAG: alpha/beta hydrolase [Desulfopila sp.]|jgi:esterase/lipase superfamily enzyme|nr:alpha/beta hydrolase [Desulfopila sp.]